MFIEINTQYKIWLIHAFILNPTEYIIQWNYLVSRRVSLNIFGIRKHELHLLVSQNIGY